MSQPVTITINGSSEALLPPERGEVSVRISDSGPDPVHIASQVRQATREIRATIEALAAKDYMPDDADGASSGPSSSSPPTKVVTKFTAGPLHTRSYLAPREDDDIDDRRDRPHRPRVHEASVRLTAEFASFAALGAFTSALADAPLAAVEGVAWALTPRTQAALRTTAIRQAYDDARAKAAAFSAAMGRGEVRPTEVRTSYDGMRFEGGGGGVLMAARGVMGKMGGAEEEEEVSPVPKEVAYEVRCEVVFEC